MSTALAPRPGTRQPAGISSGQAAGPEAGHGRLRPGPSGQRGRIRWLKRILWGNSPAKLRLLLATLLVLGLLSGVFAAVAGAGTRSGTADLGGRAQPLMAEAETIYSALADADTTAAQAFLAGGLEPAALTRRYEDDLRRAGEALSAAARRTEEGSADAVIIRDLTTGVARYAELVATARAVNRQGLPVGASYLATASRLNRDTLLPQARDLFVLAQRQVDDGFGAARGTTWVALLTLALAALLAALIWAQLHLSRSTRRTFNVPLVAATVLTLALWGGSFEILNRQSEHLERADQAGSTPVRELADARILALQVRGYEALTLAARGGEDHEPALQDASARLQSALRETPYAGTAAGDYLAYEARHRQVRQLEHERGDHEAAVALAVGPETTAAFERVRAGLDRGLEERRSVFTSEIGQAGRGLGLLTVTGPMVALLICALAVVGIRARLKEYR